MQVFVKNYGHNPPMHIVKFLVFSVGHALADSPHVYFLCAQSSMDRLQQLEVPHIATDELLGRVARSCPILRLLDCSGSSLSDQGFEIHPWLVIAIYVRLF